jgi:glycosyltransferase involved in cell wall biosynthesis
MKEATVLVRAGYSVKVFGASWLGTESRFESIAGIQMERLDLWHLRLVRWLKSLRNLSATQGMFVETSVDVRPKIDFRDWLIDLVHQIQDIVHLSTVLWAFVFKGLREKADIYHAHDVDTLLPAVIVGFLKKKPVIYDAHEYWYGARGRAISVGLMKWIERVCIRHCSHTFAVNSSIAESMALHYSVPLPTVLMNVPDCIPAEPPQMMENGHPVELLYHGYFQAGRGVEILVNAISLVKSPVHLTLRGSGDLELSLKSQVEVLGLQDKVSFVPLVPMQEVVRAASSSHIGIFFPYPKELLEFTLPNKIFEYMAAGLALITNDMVEIRKIVIGHNIGVVCKDDSTEALSQVIDELAQDRIRLEQYRSNAWHAYEEFYTWQKHQQVLLNAYRSLQTA